jgi:hypothetical protein
MKRSYLLIGRFYRSFCRLYPRTGLLSLFFIGLVSLLASCGTSTHIVSSWRDPGVVVDTAKIHQFVVAALLKNQTTRHLVEDDMAARFPGKAVQSYKVLGDGELKDDDDMYNQKLKAAGFDGVVVMQLVDVNKQTRYVPGTSAVYYGSWRRYWGFSWTGYYDPGYYTTDKSYDVEVTVFSLKRDKLIWTAQTSTVDPPGRQELFASVGKAVLDRMNKEGFLQ